MTPDIPLLKSILKTPNTPRNSSGVHFEPPRDLSGMYTGKSLSEALIMNQLTQNMTNDCSLISVHENTSSEHVVYTNWFLF